MSPVLIEHWHKPDSKTSLARLGRRSAHRYGRRHRNRNRVLRGRAATGRIRRSPIRRSEAWSTRLRHRPTDSPRLIIGRRRPAAVSSARASCSSPAAICWEGSSTRRERKIFIPASIGHRPQWRRAISTLMVSNNDNPVTELAVSHVEKCASLAGYAVIGFSGNRRDTGRRLAEDGMPRLRRCPWSSTFIAL